MNTFFSLLAGRRVDPHFGQNCKQVRHYGASLANLFVGLEMSSFLENIAISLSNVRLSGVQASFPWSRLWTEPPRRRSTEESFWSAPFFPEPRAIRGRLIFFSRQNRSGLLEAWSLFLALARLVEPWDHVS